MILELKFTDRFPFWMHDLVREFNLQAVPDGQVCGLCRLARLVDDGTPGGVDDVAPNNGAWRSEIRQECEKM